jgi:hypothetical protein
MGMNPRLLRPLARPSAQTVPQSIAGLYAWYDVSDASKVILDTVTTTTISELSDKSGGGRHLLQGTKATQPTYTAAAQNGRAAATFAGGEFMTVASVSIPQPFTVIGAYVGTALSGIRHVVTGTPSTGSLAVMLSHRNATGNQGMNCGTGFFPFATVTVWNIHHNIGNGSSSVVARNLGADSTGNAGAAGATSLMLGADPGGGTTTSFFIGSIGEVLIYTRALTRAERETLVNYLATRWGITV